MEHEQLAARWRSTLWSAWVVGALLLLSFASGATYLVVVAGSALLLALVPGALPSRARRAGGHDLAAVLTTYVVVVALFRLAFVGFTEDHVVGLFLAFATGLVVGVAGPVWWTVWVRGRPLRDLGLRRDDLPRAVGFALLFGGVQFALTLWGYDLPDPVDWVPLLGMALVVGVFESVFFRGFVQGRLEERFGTVPGIAAAAALYGLYHVGYGMGVTDIAFLTGLGVVYAVAYAVARNLVVLWPLLTPLGSFYANVEAGDITLPWASLAGFGDVLALMVLAFVLAVRHRHKVDASAMPAG